MKYGQLRGIKPVVCNDHREGLPHVQRIDWEPGLRRVKIGIHWRVCQPGIPEMHLLQTLNALQEEYPENLCAIDLWPGIDRYDVQLRFGDDVVWAVDVKDYRSPYTLATKLISFYGEGDLRYDEAFYVVPVRRLQQSEYYLHIAHEEARALPENTRLLSDVGFIQHVHTKIVDLQRGK